MSNWKIVVPEETTNYALNPIWGANSGFTAEAGTTVARSSTYQKWGPYSLRVQANADNEGVEIDLSALANAAHYVTVRVAGTLPTAWDWSLDDSNWTAPTLLQAINDDWTLYGASFVAGQANGSTTLHIHQDGAGSGDFYLDGIQVEAADHWTTLVYGKADGCEWNGAEHASTSTRSAVSRAGGRLRDLEDYYSLLMDGMDGFGMPPIEHDYDPFSILPGGSIEAVKEQASNITLWGTFQSTTSRADLHAKRQAFLGEIAPDKYPDGVFGPQPVLLRYYGADEVKEIGLVYDGGGEGSVRAQDEMWYERVAIKFTAQDPHWYEIGNSAAVLDSNDSVTTYSVMARLKSTGQWSALGLTSDPDSGTVVETVCVASDGTVYIGGNFVGLDGVTGRDRIARYSPATATWSTLVGTSDISSDSVAKIIEGPDGTIYLCGTFTDVNGVSTADYIISYDPSTDTWSSLGDPSAGTASITGVYGMAFDGSGNLYAVGDFTDFANVAACDYIAKWNGSAWSAVGTPSVAAGDIRGVGVDSQDNVWICGSFTDFATETDADYVAKWDGSSWSGGMISSVTGTGGLLSLAIDLDDTIYFAGYYYNVNGIAGADYVFKWNGHAVEAMGSGLDGNARQVAIAPDGTIYVCGYFTGTGDGSLTFYRVAGWNGSSWFHLDQSTTQSAHSIDFGIQDSVVSGNYSIFVGLAAAGAATEISGSATVTNSGTSACHPVVKVARSSGTSAKLYSVRHESTGKTMVFSHNLLDGETLTIDCRPRTRSITSSFFGQKPGAILANSDFGSFVLKPGSNQITCFVDEAGSPTVTAWLEYRRAFKGAD